MTEKNCALREQVRAMLGQALAEARTRGAARITALYLVMYDPSPQAWCRVRDTVVELSTNSLAEGAHLIPIAAQSNFVCWNCCGLRFQATEADALCPNCGGPGLVIPDEIVFSLDHIDVQ